jgi:hypothetical protein
MTAKKEHPLSSIHLPRTRERGLTVSSFGAASLIWNRNISQPDELAQRLRGFATREACYDPSTGDAFLTVAIMSVTFLTEVALFILIGLI